MMEGLKAMSSAQSARVPRGRVHHPGCAGPRKFLKLHMQI